MADERVVGIDLGTTNSLVAFMQGDKPVVIPGEDGLNLVPSVVALAPRAMAPGRPCWSAMRRGHTLLHAPERAIYSVKRLMGRGVEDVAEELKFFPFRLVEDIQPGEVLRIRLGDSGVHAAGDFRAHPAPAQAQRREVLWRAGDSGRDHRAGIF